jgi:hypothetical protein
VRPQAAVARRWRTIQNGRRVDPLLACMQPEQTKRLLLHMVVAHGVCGCQLRDEVLFLVVFIATHIPKGANLASITKRGSRSKSLQHTPSSFGIANNVSEQFNVRLLFHSCDTFGFFVCRNAPHECTPLGGGLARPGMLMLMAMWRRRRQPNTTRAARHPSRIPCTLSLETLALDT